MGHVVYPEVTDKVVTKYTELFKTKLGLENARIEVENTDYRLRLTLFAGNVRIACGSLVPLVGCCGVIISTGAWVNKEWEKRGIASLMHEMRIEIAKEGEFSLMECTIILNDKIEHYLRQRILLTNHSWKLVKSFVNSRTGNTIGVFTLDI